MAATQSTLNSFNRGGSHDPIRTQIVLSWAERDFDLSPESIHFSVRRITFDELGDVGTAIRDQDSPAYLSMNGAQVVHIFDTDFDAIIEDLQAVVGDPETDCEIVCIDGFRNLGHEHREIRDRLDLLREILAPHSIRIGIIEADPAGSNVHMMDPTNDQFTGMLKTLTLSDHAALARQREADKQDIEWWANYEYSGGRPPLGFTTIDGELVPDENYDTVCATLELVRDDESSMSKRKAAAFLNTSPRTITRCLEERPRLYGLQH